MMLFLSFYWCLILAFQINDSLQSGKSKDPLMCVFMLQASVGVLSALKYTAKIENERMSERRCLVK